MSRENVELVKMLQPSGLDLVEVFSMTPDELTTDDEAALFTDDFEVRFVSGKRAGLGNLEAKGIEGFIAMWREWLTPWKSYRLDVEDFIDAGDDVVVLARVEARTARDGVLVEHAPAAVWRIREGKVTGIYMFLERDEAFEAAAVSEELARKSE